MCVVAAGGVLLRSWWKSSHTEPPVLTVRYRTDAPATAGVAKPWLEVVNTSVKTVKLADVTLRYYYTADGDSPYGSNCVQTSLGCSHITQKTDVVGNPADGADHYLQIGFTSATGSLAPGRSSEGIGLQLYRVDHKKLNQANDRSFNADSATYAPSKRVTAYVSGARVWGDEPGGDASASGRGALSAAPEPAPAAPKGVLFDDFTPLDAGGPLTVDALKADEVQIGLLFSTDPSIGQNGFVPLADDRHLQDAENITPLIRSEKLNGEVRALLDAVSARLSTEKVTDLVGQVVIDGQDVATVANGFLTANGLL